MRKGLLTRGWFSESRTNLLTFGFFLSLDKIVIVVAKYFFTSQLNKYNFTSLLSRSSFVSRLVRNRFVATLKRR